MAMFDLMVLVEPQAALGPERLDALARGLAEDLRTLSKLQVTPATGPAESTGKSPGALQLGTLVVGGLFSATAVRALAQIAVAYINRTQTRSIRLIRGDTELEITGSTRIDDPMLAAQLARIFENMDESELNLALDKTEPLPVEPPKRHNGRGRGRD
ncbi:hypothetical protein [Micromonospora sp. NPDC005313]|uniref:hypothetical protein n=1 Tax=Micromonospora sp. NPDC005313 TaxID=3154296 RepID=UPI0033AFB992